MNNNPVATSDFPPAALVHFDSLPDSAHVRLPVVAALRGSSPATIWRHVKAGLLPAPVKLGPNTTAWRVGDLRRVAGFGRAAGEV
jgi:predicted DNA-binding transcriptional regulator AlpA